MIPCRDRRYVPIPFESLRIAACVGLALCLGCSSGLSTNLMARDEIVAVQPSEYPEHAAVILLEEDRFYHYCGTGSRRWYFQTQRHVIAQILTDDALSLAEVKLHLRSGQELLDLEARTISPDGQVRTLGKSDLVRSTSSKGGETGKLVTKEFALRMPNVEVGSIVERVYTIQQWGTAASLSGYMSWSYPTQKYRVVIEGTPEMQMEFSAYNTKAAAVLDDRGADGWTIRLAADNIPAHPTDEPDAPNAGAVRPRWAYRTTKYVIRGEEHEADNWWNHVAEAPVAKSILAVEELDDGVELPLEIRDCDEPAATESAASCRVRKIFDYVRTSIRSTGRGSWANLDKLSHVVKTGRATDWDKAFATWRFLTKAGVDAKLGLLNSRFGFPFDKAFPDLDVWDGVVVQVPPQDGISSTIWIDPACAHCQMGEVAETTKGQSAAVVLRAVRNEDGNAKANAVFTPVDGQEPEPSEERRVMTLQWEGDAALRVRAQVSRSGWQAQRRWRTVRDRKPEEWKSTVEAAVAKVSAGAVVHHAPPDVADWRVAKTTSEYDFSMSNGALRVDDEWVVPLRFMSSHLDGRYHLSPKKRQTDIVIRRRNHYADELRIPIPQGYEPSELPKTATKDAAAVLVDVRARSEDGHVIIERSWTSRPGQYPKSSHYEAIREASRLWDDVAKAVVTFRKTND